MPINNLWIHSSPLIKKGTRSLKPHKFQFWLFFQTKGFPKPVARKEPFSRMTFLQGFAHFFVEGGHVEVAFHNTQEEVPSQLRDFVECGHRSLIVWHSFIETKGTHYKDGANYCIVLHRVNLSSNMGQGLQYFFLDSRPPSFLRHSLQG